MLPALYIMQEMRIGFQDLLINKNINLIYSVTFSGKPMGSVEFFNQMVEALCIIIDRRPKGRPRKREK